MQDGFNDEQLLEALYTSLAKEAEAHDSQVVERKAAQALRRLQTKVRRVCRGSMQKGRKRSSSLARRTTRQTLRQTLLQVRQFPHFAPHFCTKINQAFPPPLPSTGPGPDAPPGRASSGAVHRTFAPRGGTYRRPVLQPRADAAEGQTRGVRARQLGPLEQGQSRQVWGKCGVVWVMCECVCKEEGSGEANPLVALALTTTTTIDDSNWEFQIFKQ